MLVRERSVPAIQYVSLGSHLLTDEPAPFNTTIAYCVLFTTQELNYRRIPHALEKELYKRHNVTKKVMKQILFTTNSCENHFIVN